MSNMFKSPFLDPYYNPETGQAGDIPYDELVKQREQKGEKEKDDTELLPVPDIKPDYDKGGGADPKTVMGQPQYAESTRLEKQIDGGANKKKKKSKAAAQKKNNYKTPEIEDYVFIRNFPKCLYKVIDDAIDAPDATQSEKIAAFVYSLVGDSSMSREVSPYVRELAENYGFDTANEIRGMRESIDKLTQMSESQNRLLRELSLMNDQEIYGLAYIMFHRLGFSLQPPVAPSEVNFNADGVDDLRNKWGKDWKAQREEKRRKDGIRLK